MVIARTISAGIFVLFLSCCTGWHENPGLETDSYPSIRRHTIKELRDQNVVKQEHDYSCGSAALATLMIYYFGHNTSEQEILNQLNAAMTEEERKKKSLTGFSLLDLKRVSENMGYRAAGFKLFPEQLARLTAPVIVFVQPRGYKHFAVFRGMSWRRVYLADPSRGNLRMSFEQFLDEWGGIIFALGKKGEDQINDYPLAIRHDKNDGPLELRQIHRQLELGSLFLNYLSFR